MSANAPETPQYANDFQIISSLDQLDRLRQVALRVKDNTGASSAAAINIDSMTTTFALPRAQAMVQLGLVNRALKQAGAGDLVELSLSAGSAGGNSDPSYPAQAFGGDTTTKITQRGIRYCIEFMGIHSTSHFPHIPKPLKYALRDYLQGADRAFVYETLIDGNNHDGLFETLVAAAALEYRPLVELCSAAVAQLLTGKSVGQMREVLGVQSDYAPEEEKELSDANKRMFPEEAHRF
jgi:hypothetical protein